MQQSILLAFDHYTTVLVGILPFLWQGFYETLKVSFVAIIAGSLLGFLIGVIRSERVPVIDKILWCYIHLLRGTPFLVQLYVFYFVMPNLNIELLKWSSTTAAFVALAVYTSSYVAEIVTSAIATVPQGQWDASTALGFTRLKTLRLIILPQAFKLMIPPMSGVYVMIIKSTAILSVVGITELTRQGEIAILRYPRDILFIYSVIAFMYFIYCYPVLRFARWTERKLGIAKVTELD